MAISLKHIKEKNHLSIVSPNKNTILNQIKSLVKKDNPTASFSSEKASGITCPACNKPEAYIYWNKPLTIHCHRENKCGIKTPITDLYPDLNAKENQAELYLLSRGLDPSPVDYEQGSYILKGKEFPTVCFIFDGIKQHRLIGDGLASKDKCRFEGKPAGKVFQPKHPHDSKEIWITESITDAYSLQQSGVNAISVLSASYSPAQYFIDNKDKVFILAFDNDIAGHNAVSKYAVFFKQNNITFKMAVPKGAKDWNEALMKNLILKGYLDSCLQHNQKEKAPLFVKYNPLNITKAEWLVSQYIPKNSVTLLYGETSCYKTFLTIDIACSIANGSDWQGRKTDKGDVIYICGEGQQGILKRIKAWCLHHGVKSVPMFLSTRSISVLDENSVTEVKEAVQELIATQNISPKLIVIDTLARTFGGDENSNKDMGLFLSNLDDMRDVFNASVLIVHHTGHESKQRARGAYALGAGVDASFLLKRIGTSSASTLTCKKMKDSELPDELMLTAIPIEIESADDGQPITSLVLESSTSPNINGLNQTQEMVYTAMAKLLEDKDQVSTQEIIDEMDLSTHSFSKIKKILIEKKFIEETQQGKNKFYSLPVYDL